MRLPLFLKTICFVHTLFAVLRNCVCMWSLIGYAHLSVRGWQEVSWLHHSQARLPILWCARGKGTLPTFCCGWTTPWQRCESGREWVSGACSVLPQVFDFVMTAGSGQKTIIVWASALDAVSLFFFLLLHWEQPLSSFWLFCYHRDLPVCVPATSH